MKNYCEECGRPIGETLDALCLSCQEEYILDDILPRRSMEQDSEGHWLDLVDLLAA